MFKIYAMNHTLLFPSLHHGVYSMRDHKDRFVLCLYEYFFCPKAFKMHDDQKTLCHYILPMWSFWIFGGLA